MGARAASLLLLVTAASGAPGLGAELTPGALRAWEQYRRLTEARIERELSSGERFLVQDFLPQAEAALARHSLASGAVFIQQMETPDPDGKVIEVPKGMIHHWFGSIFVPRARGEELLGWLQDYAGHEKYFKEVERSRLLLRHGDEFRVFLRLRRKKIVTVHYNTEHWIQYRRHTPGRVSSRSEATRIAELEGAGTPQEQEKPVGDDRGFLWRINSYWRFQERDGGMVVECESISLSRAIPPVLSWIVRGYVESVPRESLEATLRTVRDGFHSRAAPFAGRPAVR
jgi:hypothetical protein